MKALILMAVMLFGLSSYSQTYSEKYNSMLGRHEFFNSNGDMIGYKTYNSLTNSYDTYLLNDTSGQYQIKSAVNTELINNTLNSKQAKYNANRAQLQRMVDSYFKDLIYKMEDREKSKKVAQRFQNEYVNKISGYDLSNTEIYNSVDAWVANGLIRIMDEEKAQF